MIKKKTAADATKELVIVKQLPCHDTVWIRDEDEDIGEHYFLDPTMLEFICKCGFKTMNEGEIHAHLEKKHGVKDPLSEIVFPYYRKKDLPKDAKIMSYEEWQEKQRRDLDIPYIR
jgi:hypothetical protein